MVDYRKLYFILFNSITDALVEMEALNFGNASNLLKKAQISSESMYIASEIEQ